MRSSGLFSPTETGSSPATVFAETFPKVPALVRHPVRCGSPSCRCAGGDLHESWRLVWRGQDGRQRRRYVRKADLEAVRAIVGQRAEEAKAARRERAIAGAELRALVRMYRELVREVRG